MKNIITIFLFLMLSYNSFAQTPQQKITELQQQVDSLKAELLNCHLERVDLKLVNTNSLRYQERKNILLEYIKSKSEEDYKIALEAIIQTDTFIKYIDDVKAELEKRAGGIFYKPETRDGRQGAETDDHTKWGKPVKYKDKQIPQQLFVEEDYGRILKEKAIALNKQYLTYINNHTIYEPKITLKIDLASPITAGKTWEAYNFGYMPVAAIYPMFSKFRNDAENSLIAVLYYLIYE